LRKIFFIVVAAVLAAGGWLAWALLTPVVPAGQTLVLLRPGYSTRRIASELKNAGVIHSEAAFVFWHHFHRRGSLKAGEYLFEKSATVVDIHRRLVRGDIYTHIVVIPEGFTMFDIAHAIEAAGLGSAEDFLKVAQSDTALISDLAPDAQSLEGYLFPATYEFTRTQSMADIAAAMVRQFRQVAHQIGLTGQTETDAQTLTAGESHEGTSISRTSGHDHIPSGPHDGTHAASGAAGTPAKENPPDGSQSIDIQRIVIMASIVEKETALPDERPLVASVYYNRLNRRIALDADPSVIYAELLAGTYQGALHHADMQFNSPYNTYRYAGLPPGPIGNPGRSSLEAAMHPALSDYYYFVSNGNGRHHFARTFEEHTRNVAKYRRAMRGQ